MKLLIAAILLLGLYAMAFIILPAVTGGLAWWIRWPIAMCAGYCYGWYSAKAWLSRYAITYRYKVQL